MTYNLHDITDIRILPLREVRIQRLAGGDTVSIRHPEQESSVNITPVTTNRDDGSVVVLGFSIEAVIYLPYNRFADVLPALNKVTDIDSPVDSSSDVSVIRNPVFISLFFGGEGAAAAVESGAASLNATGSLQFSYSGSVSYSIESVPLRHRIKVQLVGSVRGETLNFI